MAGELGLEPIMNKPDSQDLCFVGDSLNDFWKNHYQKSIRHGNIVDLNGNILGSHEGIVHYTIGQRKGLGIAHEEPLYVLKINAGKNEVVVGPRDQTFSDGLEASGLNWSAIDPPTKPLKAHIRIRYRSELVPATIEVTAPDTVRVRFDDPQSAISPGQITVFYDSNDMLLGGGVIEKALVLTEPVSV